MSCCTKERLERRTVADWGEKEGKRGGKGRTGKREKGESAFFEVFFPENLAGIFSPIDPPPTSFKIIEFLCLRF